MHKLMLIKDQVASDRQQRALVSEDGATCTLRCVVGLPINPWPMAIIHSFSLGRFAFWDASRSEMPLREPSEAEELQFPRGSKNDGQVCYMNAVLQALYHVPLARQVSFVAPCMS